MGLHPNKMLDSQLETKETNPSITMINTLIKSCALSNGSANLKKIPISKPVETLQMLAIVIFKKKSAWSVIINFSSPDGIPRQIKR